MQVNGQEVRRLRDERGLSRTQLEKLSGVDRANIETIEKGRSLIPRGDVVEKLAKALEVNPAMLLSFNV